MSVKLTLFSLLFLFNCLQGRAQFQELSMVDSGFFVCKTPQKISLREIVITDSFLLKEIHSFINQKNSRDSSVFKKFGYIWIDIDRKSYQSKPVLRSYHISERYYHFSNRKDDSFFPIFYSLINGRIICINFTQANMLCLKFTKKSKKKFLKKVNPFLEPLPDVVVHDENGKELILTKMETTVLHAGKIIYLFADQSQPVVVLESNY